MKLRVATVFSGIGALEQALLKKNISHEIVFACDNGERDLNQSFDSIMDEFKSQDKQDMDSFIEEKYSKTNKRNYVKDSYLKNYNPKAWHEDIRFLDGKIYKNKVDLLVGGSPCQSFSVYGKRAGLEDTRGTLFYDYARLVKDIEPSVFIFENVPGMLSHDNGNTWKTIKEVFESLNYSLYWKLLNAVDYEIPQNRNRLFLVGFKESFYRFKFPKAVELKTTLFDFLQKKVDSKHYLGKKGFMFVTDNVSKHKNRARINQSIIKTQVANQQFNWIGDFIFEEYDECKHNALVMRRAFLGNYNGKLGVVRQLTPRECLRLMGFSDSFQIVVPNFYAYRQAGNSIVVNVLEHLIDSIIDTGVFNDEDNLKVATAFSGIGAFEYALKKLEINHEVVFACDNGNREISYNQDLELANVRSLKSIEEKRRYVDNLYSTKTSKKNFVQQSYQANHKIESDRYFQDICLLDGKDFYDKVDIFMGGRPCQTFSTVGFQHGLEDARGTLFYDFARLVKEMQPKVFVYENVRGLLTHDKGNTFEIVKGIFDSLGYKYYYDVLNSKDYGLPQNRRRLFVVGFKDHNVSFNFPKPIELEYSMQDFLLEQCKEGSLSFNGRNYDFGEEGEIVEHKYFLTDKLYKYVMASGTKTFYQKPEIDLPVARTILATMGNRHRAGIDNYVTIDGKVRMLTEREALRLMGFGDDYKIVVSRAQAYKQAGNSIPVPLLAHIINAIYETGVL